MNRAVTMGSGKCRAGREGTTARVLILLFFFSLLLPFFSAPLLAQGCAMCKTAVASQGASMMEALNLGIIVLLVPPIGILTTILVFAFRRDE